MDYTKITTFEKACEVRGYDPKLKPVVTDIPVHLQGFITSVFELAVAAEAINTDKDGKLYKPDYTDGTPKYTAAWVVDADAANPSGRGFSDADYGNWGTLASVGSRFCFPTLPQVRHFQKYFEKQHIKMQLITE